MTLNAKKVPSTGKSNRVEQPILEAGGYPARVVQILDLGLQPQRPYQGEDKPPAYEIQLTYEFSDVFMVDEEGNELEDKPRWISETFPLRSLEADLAKSTKRYKALDPEEVHGGDFGLLLDTPCMVTVVVNKKGDKVYENVGNVGPMRARDVAKCPELKNTPKFFALDEPDLDVFNALPKWLQDKITSNLEFKGSLLEELLSSTEGKEKTKPTKGKAKPAPVDEEDPPFDADGEDAPY